MNSHNKPMTQSVRFKEWSPDTIKDVNVYNRNAINSKEQPKRW